MKFTRKEFICLMSSGIATLVFPEKLIATLSSEKRVCEFFKRVSGTTIKCTLCPRFCTITNGQTGFCMSRKNFKGELYPVLYERPCFIDAEDRLEKGPIYHAGPFKKALGIATATCNLRCLYCQNWQFALLPPDKVKNFTFTVKQAVKKARDMKADCIIFSYTEPTSYYEYMLDIAKEAKKYNIKSAMVTAGFINPLPLKKALNYIDFVVIGLKGFNQKFYRYYAKCDIFPILKTLEVLEQARAWYEISYLLIPSLNDNLEEIEKMCKQIKKNLNAKVPLHFLRFVPMYKLKNIPPTPLRLLETARKIALDAGLKYVYIENFPGHEANSTFCHKCGKLIIRRIGFEVKEIKITKGKCIYCNAEIPGKWEV